MQVGASYHYDGDGRRVKKVVGTSTTIFVYNAGGQLIAEYSNITPTGAGGTSYLTSDSLGTPRVITNSDGSVKSRHDYLPFGEDIAAAIGNRSSITGYSSIDDIRQKFTQKERDVESGLDYFNARYYSSAQGRFTGTDPIIITNDRLIDPQEINLYNYARNNPLRFTDPTGEDIDDSSLADNRDYQKWKKAFLATEAGKALWNKYADDHSVNVTITMGDNDGGRYGAETTPTFDANGRLTGASIVLGTEFAKKAAAGTYPIGGQLSSDDPSGGAPVSREARAVAFLAHEFGHIEDAQRIGGAVWQRENALIQQSSAGFKKMGNAWYRSTEYQKLLSQCNCSSISDIHDQREIRAERATIPVIQDYFGRHAGHGDMPKRVQQAIQNYQKAHPQ